MRNIQLSMLSTLVNMQSNAFSCIQLPANFGQHSWEEINSLYEESILDLPRSLVHAVSIGEFSQANPPMMHPQPARPIIPNTWQGKVGGPRICAFLHDRLVYLALLITEVIDIQNLLHLALGGFDAEEINIYHAVGLDFSDLSRPLNPLAAYFLRALVRMRMSDVEYRLVSKDIEQILETIAHVHRGLLAPAVRMSSRDQDELLTQLRAWESVYLDIQVKWHELCSGFYESTIFHRDQQRRREFKKWQNGHRA
ncbi:hypothetical protein LA080_005327 [Diaporthe eres]|nr:hypothetical protein LA080_005327 [Diaporthe eres]